MSGSTVNLGAQVLAAGAPGAALIGPNTKVKGQLGFVSLQVDALSFSNAALGNWIAPNTRTRVNGVFMISQTSQGLAVVPPGVTVPIQVISGDPKLRSL